MSTDRRTSVAFEKGKRSFHKLKILLLYTSVFIPVKIPDKLYTL